MKQITKAYSHLNLQKRAIGDKTWPIKTLNKEIIEAEAIIVNTYHELVVKIAEISYYNPEHILYFRGQEKDYKDYNGLTTIYPKIFRDLNATDNLKIRLNELDVYTDKLINTLKSEKQTPTGTIDIQKFKELAWAIIQHYGVYRTPLLDLTHSLHVACSFAFCDNKSSYGCVYVFGMPFITDIISYHTRNELINIRLLAISPPDAKRPYFQEGYLAGTFPYYDYSLSSHKHKFDFRRRLIAKILIPIKHSFWGNDFGEIPKSSLYPMNDTFNDICDRMIITKTNRISTSLKNYIKN